MKLKLLISNDASVPSRPPRSLGNKNQKVESRVAIDPQINLLGIGKKKEIKIEGADPKLASNSL